MGREIYSIIKDRTGKKVWDSSEQREFWICGRDSATSYIASLVPDYTKDSWEVNITDKHTFISIQRQLKEYQDQDEEVINDAKKRLEDLYAARRRARSLAAFAAFDEEIERVKQFIQEEDFSRAKELIRLMDETREALVDLDKDGKGEYSLYLVDSE